MSSPAMVHAPSAEALRDVIVTGCRSYGDFLLDHWLASLKAHSSLEDVSIVVLDYGLNFRQRERLAREGVRIVSCDGSVWCSRLRDAAAILESHPYRRALFCDSGDIIFQTDVQDIFALATSVRAAYEDIRIPLGTFRLDGFAATDSRKIKESLRDRRMINVGLVVGPAKELGQVLGEAYGMITRPELCGPDQVSVDYVLHQRGFEPLPQRWNYTVTTASQRFWIAKGTFLTSEGPIPVVHNCGSIPWLRPIKDFGFGPDHNRLKRLVYFVLRTYYGAYRLARGLVKPLGSRVA